jgi:hypothetical protein
MKLGGIPVVPVQPPTQRINPLYPPAVPPAAAPSPSVPTLRPIEPNPFTGFGSPPPATGNAEAGPDFGEMVAEAKTSESKDQTANLWAELPRPLPSYVEALGFPLDAFRSEGRKRKLNRLGLTYFAIWLAVSGMALLMAIRTKSPGVFLLFLAISGIALLVLLAVTFLRVGMVLVLARSYRVFIFNDGLVYQEGERFEVFRWDAVQFVEHSSFTDVSDAGVTRIRHSLIIADRGNSMELDEELMGIDRLADQVVARATQQQLEQALETVRDGQSLLLGTFRLDLSGLEYRDRIYRWHEFDRCVRRNGRLSFRLRFDDDYCIEVDTTKVPRSFLIHAIARSFISEDH